MYCGKCGTKNVDQARHCSSCGAPLGPGPVQQAGAYYDVPQQQATTQSPYAYPPQAPYQQPAQPYQQPAQPYQQPVQPYQQPAPEQPYKQHSQPYRQPVQPYKQPAQSPTNKKKTGLIIGIAAAALVVIVAVVLFFLLGGSKGIVGKWVVIGEDSYDFSSGMILNFTKDGEVKLEISDTAPEQLIREFREIASSMEKFMVKYRVSDDYLDLAMLDEGRVRNELTLKYMIEGNILIFFDDDGDLEAVLKRTK
jgi:hypothetical protein